MITVEQLRATGQFEPFSDAELEAFLGATVTRTFAPREVLCQQSRPATSCFIIVSGEVDVVKESAGRERLLTRLSAGAIAGQLALIDRALQWDRRNRFPDARAMREELGRVLAALESGTAEVAHAENRVAEMIAAVETVGAGEATAGFAAFFGFVRSMGYGFACLCSMSRSSCSPASRFAWAYEARSGVQ